MSAISEWLKNNPRPFNFFGNRQYLPKSQYEMEMEKKWRNPWQSYGEEAGRTAPAYSDKILRDEARRISESQKVYGGRFGGEGFTPSQESIPEVLSRMKAGMQPMDMTRYYKERDTGFAGAMAKTIASGLAKAAKPKKMSGGRVRVGGGQRTFTPDSYNMTSWIAPAAPSGYGETIDPTIETYLRPWRLKHGYT